MLIIEINSYTTNSSKVTRTLLERGELSFPLKLALNIEQEVAHGIRRLTDNVVVQRDMSQLLVPNISSSEKVWEATFERVGSFFSGVPNESSIPPQNRLRVVEVLLAYLTETTLWRIQKNNCADEAENLEQKPPCVDDRPGRVHH